MSLYKKFATDTSLEKEGVLLQYGENSHGKAICIRVARAGGSNKRYLERLEQRFKPLRRQVQNETIERGLMETIIRQVFAETVVLGWENVEDAEGKPLPFTRENCLKLFDDLPDLFADIKESAESIALFRAEVREVDAKN
jgi:hypothetical protein